MSKDIENYYKTLGVDKKINKDNLNNQKLYNLNKKPKKQKIFTKIYSDIPYGAEQADLLFLPNDKGYKYLLVVVDVATRRCDFEGLKTKDTKEIVKAFEKIFKRDILKMPKLISVDSGKEFKGYVSQYFHDNKVGVKTAQPNAHTTQALVENRNKQIGNALFQRMNAQELITGEVSKEWIDELPQLRKDINKDLKKPKFTPYPLITNKTKLLKVGDKVRVKAEKAVDVEGNVLLGKLRGTDYKWIDKTRTIKYILVGPNGPPMYLLNGNVNRDNVHGIEPRAYSFESLQLIPKDEEYPPASVLRSNKNLLIDKIISKIYIKKKPYYFVKYRGLKYDKKDKPISHDILKIEYPELLKEFEDNN